MKDKFEFYQDVKCSIWYRNVFMIEAENKEEAIQKAMSIKEDVSNIGDTGTYGIVDDNSMKGEFLFEALEPMSIEDNDGHCTIEMYRGDNNELISENTDFFNKKINS